jgi:hypothetical protein
MASGWIVRGLTPICAGLGSPISEPGRCSSTLTSPAAPISLAGLIGFSRSTPNTPGRGSGGGGTPRIGGFGCGCRDQHQRAAFPDPDASSIFAAREMGTAKFDPEKPDRIAKFTPITLPLLSNTGPPDPPEVVCAS